MAFNTSLVVTQFYTQADPYFYTVDNRPLVNLDARDTQLANELDRRTIAVDVTGAATCTVTTMPSGWTIVTNGTGDYTITHATGNTNYIVVPTIVNATVGIVYTAVQTGTTIQIKTTNSAGTPTHMRFQLLVMGY